MDSSVSRTIGVETPISCGNFFIIIIIIIITAVVIINIIVSFRYIRWSSGQNNYNEFSHFNEIIVQTVTNTNIASSAIITIIDGTVAEGTSELIKDGDINTFYGFGDFVATKASIQLDFGTTPLLLSSISYIKFWQYFADGMFLLSLIYYVHHYC